MISPAYIASDQPSLRDIAQKTYAAWLIYTTGSMSTCLIGDPSRRDLIRIGDSGRRLGE